MEGCTGFTLKSMILNFIYLMVFLQNGVTGGSELKLERVMKCPQQLQGNEWQITAEDHCGHGVNASFYHCVQEQVSGYVQLCIQPIVVRKGSYVLWSNAAHKLYPELCPWDRYQEVDMLSNKFYQCEKKKSSCDEPGMLASDCDDGGTTRDRMCRCDYMKDYVADVYALSNVNKETCFSPSTASGGCTYLPCGKNQVLNKVYQCIPKCEDGYYMPDMSMECVPIPVTSSTVSTTVALNITTTLNVSSSVSPETTPAVEERNESNLWTGIAVGLLLVVVGGLVWCVYDKKIARKHAQGAPFKKTEDNVQLLTSIDDLMALGIQSAVGKILAYDSSGTGFLVNQKYVFTAFHVVDEVFFHLWKQILNVLINCETNFNDDLWRDINKAKNIEDFEHKKDKVLKCLEDVTIPKVIQEAQQKFRDTRDEHVIVRLNQIVNDFKRRVETEEGGHKFKIVFNVLSESDGTGRGHFFSLDTPFVSVKEDVIILQLQDPSEVTSKPLLLNVDDSSSHETFDIYGYPDSSGLKVDRNCFKFTGSIGEFCKKAKEYFKGLRGINEDHIKLRDYTLNPQNHYIHCSPTMAHGTSGAPCIIYQNINGSIYPTVVGIYTCGYPRFAYYNNVWKDLQNSENKEFFKHLIEGGSTMKNCLELIRTRDSDLHRDLAPPATPHDLYISHELPIINMLTDKEIKEGDSYTIACVIRGTYGSFSWTFASVNDSDIYQEITNTENIEKVGTGLKLREVTCEMEGYYNCTVRFCGHEIKRDIYLKVVRQIPSATEETFC